MEIPFQIKSSCRLPFTEKKKNLYMLFFGDNLFHGSGLRNPISKISCFSVEQGLKPRPLPRPPTKINLDREKETQLESPPVSNPGTGLCHQIDKLVLHKRYQEALELFEILECECVFELNGSTYDALVNACISLKSIRGVKRVFGHMLNSGFKPDQYMMNRVLLMHVKCGMMIDARKLFDDMPQRNMVSWNTIIAGLVDIGEYKEAFRLFLGMWEQHYDAGSRTFATMIRASAGLELVYPGIQLHSCALKMGLSENIFISCALIDMYSKCGSIEDAQCVFDVSPKHGYVSGEKYLFPDVDEKEERMQLYHSEKLAICFWAN